MSLLFDDFINILLSQLTDDERQGCVAYAADKPLLAGTQIPNIGMLIEVKNDSFVGFIDREPKANWGHSARYVIVNQGNGEILSLEVRFPPSTSDKDLHWRVIYQAPSIPDSALYRLS